MSAKRFKTLSGYLTNVSPVKEGKKQHNWAEAHLQTGTGNEEKVLFFFEKPKVSSALYESALSAFEKKTAIAVSALSEDNDGTFLTCRTSEIKPRQVTFEREEVPVEAVNIGSAISEGSSSDDATTISGRVVKLNSLTSMMKYDNTTQQRVEKVYRTGIIADASAATMIIVWEDIAHAIREGSSIALSNMRPATDGKGIAYFTTTFRTVLKNLLESDVEYNEEAAETLMDCELTLFQEITCTIESVLLSLHCE